MNHIVDSDEHVCVCPFNELLIIVYLATSLIFLFRGKCAENERMS
jgi:hypothetical protein